MLVPLSEEKRTELLPWTYFVGVGYFPSVESFALGMTPSEECLIADVFSAETLETEVNRLIRPTGWKQIFFIVTSEPGRMQVTKEDALWFLKNRAEY
ncbi:hypothetical protein C4561_05215 [candidate division WWE3 bacterium]|jgi:hypothetical protein|uniref:Uncharacterized protein n=1 Tax=candidate division WWE3 bacterium TaxID=2053526 RepID=A0A3A4ZIZ1_UNCKA|nr:MAG: hypothetical protein C4561_05215 [candidate division WWE3 bacterium]